MHPVQYLVTIAVNSPWKHFCARLSCLEALIGLWGQFMDFVLRIWMTSLLLLFLSQKTYTAGDLSTLDRGARGLLDLA